MRLIDADNLGIAKADIEILGDTLYVDGWNSALKAISEAAPTIDPETLPIVQELRKQLAQVTAERNYAITVLENKVKYNEFPCIHCKSEGVVCYGVKVDYCGYFEFRGLQEVQNNG